ncbi:hypothetical protein QPX54_06235 [Corynebacterium propinquum]|uniref:Uncharacterized protein n=1 Tax=Corynebacterium propinquum TaxID=43769 RepID=A0AAP4F6W5_9CORY|nr:hypothetical protein [Corynebacterium propinquum]MDK4326110.1 hypothetical protein [Corynebacterium propinquum]
MTKTHAREALRRLAAGKRITKARHQDLTDNGYITTDDNGRDYVTPQGTQLLNEKDAH